MGKVRNPYILVENLKGRGHLGYLEVNGRIILTGSLKIRCEDVDRIYLARDSVQWQGLENAVVKLLIL
jgi:hypothetical protein